MEALFLCAALAVFLGPVFGANDAAPDKQAPRRTAVRIAERLLKLPTDDINARQKCIDELARLGEDALPGLERILHGHLSRSLGGTREQDGRVVDLILGRFTAPREPWEPDALAFQVDYGETHEEAMKRAVRRPWLRPFLLKVLKHHFTSQRRFFLWGVWYHLKDPVPDLCEFAGADPDPSVRANALILLTEVSPLPREALREVLPQVLRREQVASPRTVALGIAAEFRVRSVLPELLDLLNSRTTVDTSLTTYLSRAVFWGEPPEPTGPEAQRFAATMGQLAAYAIQEITGRDFGFKSCYQSRGEMPQIIERIRAAYPEHPPGNDGR